jgi:hypothetical protein
VLSQNRFSRLFCLLLPHNKLYHLYPSTASATLSSMPHQTNSSPPSQKYNRSYNHISTRTHSRNSPYRPESQRKHALTPSTPFGASPSSQHPTSELNDEYSSIPRFTSRLSTSEETTTLEKIWGSLFDKDGQPTTRLSQLLRGLAMHIVRLGSGGIHW